MACDAQEGPRLRTLTWRALQGKHPFLDFRWGLRVLERSIFFISVVFWLPWDVHSWGGRVDGLSKSHPRCGMKLEPLPVLVLGLCTSIHRSWSMWFDMMNLYSPELSREKKVSIGLIIVSLQPTVQLHSTKSAIIQATALLLYLFHDCRLLQSMKKGNRENWINGRESLPADPHREPMRFSRLFVALHHPLLLSSVYC